MVSSGSRFERRGDQPTRGQRHDAGHHRERLRRDRVADGGALLGSRANQGEVARKLVEGRLAAGGGALAPGLLPNRLGLGNDGRGAGFSLRDDGGGTPVTGGDELVGRRDGGRRRQLAARGLAHDEHLRVAGGVAEHAPPTRRAHLRHPS